MRVRINLRAYAILYATLGPEKTWRIRYSELRRKIHPMLQPDPSRSTAAVHFGAFLKMVRHRHSVRQLQVLVHLAGWTQTTYSRVETGEIAPAFDQLASIYAALRLAGVEWTPQDRQQFLTLARTRIETKKTYQEHRTDQEWDELRLKLSRTDQDAHAHGPLAPHQQHTQQ